MDDIECAARALHDANPWWHGQETAWQDFRPEAKLVIEALARKRKEHQCDDRCVDEFGYQTRACPAA